MVISDKVKTLIFGLQLQMLPHGAKIIANMKFAGWLNP